MIRNFYINVSSEIRLQMFYQMLSDVVGSENWFDATDCDSYTSGPCALDSIKAIQEDIQS